MPHTVISTRTEGRDASQFRLDVNLVVLAVQGHELGDGRPVENEERVGPALCILPRPCKCKGRVTRRQNRCQANGAMDFFSMASGGVIVSAPTVSSDTTATAAALSAADTADVIGAETRRSASAMVSRFLRNAGALLSFFGALTWRRVLMWRALEQLSRTSTATTRRM